MFGDMEGMMAKLKEAQAKIEETRIRLDTIMVDGDAGNGMVVATVTGNREVKNIAIDNELLDDKEALEDYLIIALNKAIEKANGIHEAEMAAAAKGGLPDLPGMDLFK
jgi:DNA-binding YbaB/EbfC family protein